MLNKSKRSQEKGIKKQNTGQMVKKKKKLSGRFRRKHIDNCIPRESPRAPI